MPIAFLPISGVRLVSPGAATEGISTLTFLVIVVKSHDKTKAPMAKQGHYHLQEVHQELSKQRRPTLSLRPRRALKNEK